MTATKKKAGRPPLDPTERRDEVVFVRLTALEAATLDAWIKRHGKPGMGRPEAIRRLTIDALLLASRTQ